MAFVTRLLKKEALGTPMGSCICRPCEPRSTDLFTWLPVQPCNPTVVVPAYSKQHLLTDYNSEKLWDWKDKSQNICLTKTNSLPSLHLDINAHVGETEGELYSTEPPSLYFCMTETIALLGSSISFPPPQLQLLLLVTFWFHVTHTYETLNFTYLRKAGS